MGNQVFPNEKVLTPIKALKNIKHVYKSIKLCIKNGAQYGEVLHLHFIAIIHLLYELCIRMYGLGKSCLWIACHRALESLQGH